MQAKAKYDDDPASPQAEREVSDTAGLELASVLANLGVPMAIEAPAEAMAMAAAAVPSVNFDVARALGFLKACLT